PDAVFFGCFSPSPAALHRSLRGATGHVAHPIRFIRRSRMIGRLTSLLPHDVFLVSPVDQRIYFTVGSVAEKNSAFDPFAEEKLCCFRQQLFPFALPFNK